MWNTWEEELRWPHRGLEKLDKTLPNMACAGRGILSAVRYWWMRAGDAPPSTHGVPGTSRVGCNKNHERQLPAWKSVRSIFTFVFVWAFFFLREFMQRLAAGACHGLFLEQWERVWPWHSAGRGMSAIWDGKTLHHSLSMPVIMCLFNRGYL